METFSTERTRISYLTALSGAAYVVLLKENHISSFYIFGATNWPAEDILPYLINIEVKLCSPGLQSGEAGFQTRENAFSCNDRALALVRMLRAPQSTRTFFVTSTTAGRRALLQSDRMAQLLVDVLAENRRKRRFLLHEFVIMPNHFHLLLTPAAEIPLEKALQFIKGGFSYRAKRETHFAFEVWQASFVNHRIRDAADYKHHHTYIWENPVRAGLSERPELFTWSSASLRLELDAPPPGLKP